MPQPGLALTLPETLLAHPFSNHKLARKQTIAYPQPAQTSSFPIAFEDLVVMQRYRDARAHGIPQGLPDR